LFGRDPFQEKMEGLLEEWDLLDIKPKKETYTWTNMGLGPRHIATRLDIFLIHSHFLSSNTSIKSYILPSLTYDHKPISLHIHDLLKYGPLPFHFNPLLINHPKVISLVELNWKAWVLGTPVYIWEQKLIVVKQALKIWAKSFYIPSDKEKKYLKVKLDNLQKENENKDTLAQL